MKWLNIPDRFLVPDSNVLLFRYLDNKHAIDLLNSNEIYFSKASIHGEYAEGVLSKIDKILLKKDYKKSYDNNWEYNYKNTINKVNQYKNETFISCWNASQTEKKHMWETYTKTNDSCIIVTNTNLFLDALINSSSTHEFDIAKVYYFDINTGLLKHPNTLSLFARKTKDYSIEDEVRAIIQLDSSHQIPDSIRVSVDLKKFCLKIIYNSKASPEFIAELDFLASKHNVYIEKSQDI